MEHFLTPMLPDHSQALSISQATHIGNDHPHEECHRIPWEIVITFLLKDVVAHSIQVSNLVSEENEDKISCQYNLTFQSLLAQEWE